MLRCKQVTTMVANDDLADAGLWVRLQVRLHLWICRHCAGYAAQMRQLGVKLREQFRHEDDPIDTKRLERQILDAARSARALLLGVVLGIALGMNAVRAEGREMKVAFEHDGDPVYEVLPPGRIPAIDEPRFLSGEAAAAQMAPEEAVFGITSGDEARAYSLWQLDHHEIVNDRFGGIGLAATW